MSDCFYLHFFKEFVVAWDVNLVEFNVNTDIFSWHIFMAPKSSILEDYGKYKAMVPLAKCYAASLFICQHAWCIFSVSPPSNQTCEF